jgi:hypothetical protein
MICRRDFHFRLVCYLDDFLVFGETKAVAERYHDFSKFRTLF